MSHPTSIMLACVALFLLVWNVVATAFCGNTASISYNIAKLAETNPWIPIVAAMLLAHWFWPTPNG